MDSQWNWRWSSHLRRGHKTNMFYVLLDCLLNYQFSSKLDKWLWKNKDNAKFDVKQVRWLFDIEAKNNCNSFKCVSWIPIKTICFVWRLIQDKISTFTYLSKRGVVFSTSCQSASYQMILLIMFSLTVSMLQSYGVG